MCETGIIYLLTNTAKDNRPYVGQTVGSLEARWKQHVWDAREDWRLDIHEAIRRYGTHAFEKEVLETCERDELDDYEIMWIARLDSYYNGYNMTNGGVSGTGKGHARWGAKKKNYVAPLKDDVFPSSSRLSTLHEIDPNRYVMLQEFLTSLPVKWRVVLEARMEGYTFQEIGDRGTYVGEICRKNRLREPNTSMAVI